MSYKMKLLRRKHSAWKVCARCCLGQLEHGESKSGVYTKPQGWVVPTYAATDVDILPILYGVRSTLSDSVTVYLAQLTAKLPPCSAR